MMIRRSFLFGAALLAISGALTLPRPAAAADLAATAPAFVERIAKKAIAAMSAPHVTPEAARHQVRTLLTEGFDLPLIGRFVLGRYWNAATPQQQQEFQSLFQNMIVQSYADRFAEYKGEQLRVGAARVDNLDAFVSSQMVRPNGPPVEVEWRVRERNGALRIIDVVVENVSMSVTQRQEFASVIQSRGGQIEGLLQALRQKNFSTD